MLTTISLFTLLLPLALGSTDQSASNQRRATYTDVLLKRGDQFEPSCLGVPFPLQSGGQVVAVDCNETDGTHILLWNLSDGQGQVIVSLGDETFALQAGGNANDESVFIQPPSDDALQQWIFTSDHKLQLVNTSLCLLLFADGPLLQACSNTEEPSTWTPTQP
ncbi:hypothetical protein M231_03784 [Tremella mesenterica]|uniref:Ricin B lectin domain-containing protein n=1 Tax=Tremella mesenterica TaxID=5217 RepID=A0A4Q1BMA0_TREME|nr:hypothetical protein M231_03784 [Tremella mesenterica]